MLAPDPRLRRRLSAVRSPFLPTEPLARVLPPPASRPSPQRFRMSPPIPPTALDRILALQLTVAWAGESHGEPPHLGWWAASLSDPEGGGDFLKRMLPRTHVWAALGGMREAARRTDERARSRTAAPDELITLYHFGFGQGGYRDSDGDRRGGVRGGLWY